jgi:hypothetical protein
MLSILAICDIGALEVGEKKGGKMDDMFRLVTSKAYYLLIMFFSFFVEFPLKIHFLSFKGKSYIS